VDEVIRIADEAHVRGVVTHIKALGPDSWGKSADMIAHIDAARARGVDVFADQYPYDASSTSLAAAVMPGESSEGLKEAMANDAAKEKFLGLVKDNIRRRGGPASIVMASGRGAGGLAGKSLDAIAKERGVPVEQAAADIVLAGGASIVSFNMSEADVEAIMRMPWTMGSSDGALSVPGPAMPHPRNNGSFARRIERYVVGRKTLTLVEAIRTMTSLPGAGVRPDRPGDDSARCVCRHRHLRSCERERTRDLHVAARAVGGLRHGARQRPITRHEGAFTAVRAGVVLKR
jgi:N-acyl-D-amino-acid deacylase